MRQNDQYDHLRIHGKNFGLDLSIDGKSKIKGVDYDQRAMETRIIAVLKAFLSTAEPGRTLTLHLTRNEDT